MQRGLVATRFGYVHYRCAGAGSRAVVVSHINQQSSALMIELLAALAPKVRAVAIDYPGCGASDHVPETPGIAGYAEGVFAVMESLGIERAAALGEATGAFVSAHLACSHPQRIERAILVNCPYYPVKEVHQRAHAPLRDRLRPADPSGFPLTRTLDFMLGEDAAHSPVNADQSWMDRINVAQMEAGRDRWQPLQALGDYDLLACLPRIAVPVHFLMGELFHYRKDLASIAAYAQTATAEVITGARFCVTWSHAALLAARTFEWMGL